MADEFVFAKMHGAGNDFIMIADMEDSFETDAGLIRSLCEPHRGIGADGLIFVRPSATDDFAMEYYNRDGSRAEMCGNGARCTALFAYERGLAGRKMRFQTGAGPVSAEMIEDGVRISIEPVTGIRLGLDVGEGLTAGFAVSGVPHAAVPVPDVRGIERERFISHAREIRNADMFSPGGTNVNFVTVVSQHRIEYRTYERGVEEETLACGTGAVGVSVILAHMGKVSPPVECGTSGGDVLRVGFELSRDGAVGCTLSGPAKTSFLGTAKISDFIPRA